MATMTSSMNRLSGLNVCITGALTTVRHEFQRMLRDHGAVPVGNVTRNTDVLIVGDRPGSKLGKAQSMNIPVISERDALTLLTQPAKVTSAEVDADGMLTFDSTVTLRFTEVVVPEQLTWADSPRLDPGLDGSARMDGKWLQLEGTFAAGDLQALRSELLALEHPRAVQLDAEDCTVTLHPDGSSTVIAA